MKTKKTKRKDFAKLHKNQGALFSEVKNDLKVSSLQSDSSDSTINYNTSSNYKYTTAKETVIGSLGSRQIDLGLALFAVTLVGSYVDLVL